MRDDSVESSHQRVVALKRHVECDNDRRVGLRDEVLKPRVFALLIILGGVGFLTWKVVLPKKPAVFWAEACARASDEECCIAHDEAAAACAKGKGAACESHGIGHELQYAMPTVDAGEEGRSLHKARAKAVYARGCELGHGPACWRAASLRVASGDDRSEGERDLALLERGCDVNDGESCSRLASVFELANGRPKDLSRARVLYEKACSLSKKPGDVPLACKYAEELATGTR
jgi:TPR repeat protein